MFWGNWDDKSLYDLFTTNNISSLATGIFKISNKKKVFYDLPGITIM